MWQTILNAFTFHENFARQVRAGTLRPGGAWGRLKFGIDAVVTVLAALPVAIVSAPLELFAAPAGRGGELVAVARRGGLSRRTRAPASSRAAWRAAAPACAECAGR